jgi:hypothetical protein
MPDKRRSDLEVLREYAVRAVDRLTVCLVLAAVVIAWDALLIPRCLYPGADLPRLAVLRRPARRSLAGGRFAFLGLHIAALGRKRVDQPPLP